MDLSDPDSLLRRVRWPNVARLAALVLLAVAAALLPRLPGSSPAVPSGVVVPVLAVPERQPDQRPEPKAAPVRSKPPPPTRAHHKRVHHKPAKRRKAKPRRGRSTTTPVPPVLSPAAAVNPALREFRP